MLVNLTIPPGVVEDESEHKVGIGAWAEADLVRFWRGSPQVWGGWEFVTTDQLSGTCRGLFSWLDNSAAWNIGLGTSEALYVIVQGDFFDITPASGFTAGLETGTGGRGYGAGAYSVGYYSRPSDQDFWPLTWSMAAFGQSLIACPRGQTLFRWDNDGAVVATSLGRALVFTADFTSYADQTAFDAVWTRGTGWTFDAANDEADCDGTQTGNSDLTRSVTTTSGKWHVLTVPFSNRSAGSISALAAGAAGTSSSDASGSVTTTFKATSSSTTLGARADADWVGTIDDGLTVHELNAPDNTTYVTVTPERFIMAYGCNEEASNAFNPRCIRHSDLNDADDWVSEPGNSAREYILDASGALIGAKETAFGAFVWTTDELFFRTYVGSPEAPYRFDRIGTGCGLIGPNAAAVLGQVAYWMGADGQFWRCPVGGAPERVPCPVQKDIADNLAGGQQAKVYAATNTEFNEVWWSYPDKRDDADENNLANSRIITFSAAGDGWSGPHDLARTAIIDSGVTAYPVAVGTDGYVYFHERGNNANGGALSWALETGDIVIAEGGRVAQIVEYRPDIIGQQGAVTLTVYTKMYAQGDETTATTKTIAVGQDRVHFRASGRMIRLKFSGEAAPSYMRLGKVVLDMSARGRR